MGTQHNADVQYIWEYGASGSFLVLNAEFLVERRLNDLVKKHSEFIVLLIELHVARSKVEEVPDSEVDVVNLVKEKHAGAKPLPAKEIVRGAPASRAGAPASRASLWGHVPMSPRLWRRSGVASSWRPRL